MSVVEQFGFLLVEGVHFGEAADVVPEPLEDELHQVDGEGRGRVVERVFLDVVVVAEVAGEVVGASGRGGRRG